MSENKYPWTDGEDQSRDLNQRIKWDIPDTYFEPEPKKKQPDFLLWFLPQFIQHVGEVMVGVSLCRFIWDAELYMNRLQEFIQLILPK